MDLYLQFDFYCLVQTSVLSVLRSQNKILQCWEGWFYARFKKWYANARHLPFKGWKARAADLNRDIAKAATQLRMLTYYINGNHITMLAMLIEGMSDTCLSSTLLAATHTVYSPALLVHQIACSPNPNVYKSILSFCDKYIALFCIFKD